MIPPLALYVHIPFCQTKCPYCDFNTYAAIEPLMPAYVDALGREIAGWGAWLGRPVLKSVFFGGGTPSYLPTRDLSRLMRTIEAAFDVPDGAELTLEANPGDCTRERLQTVRHAGFNRISIGVQSFDDNELRLLGRRHSARQSKRAVLAARRAGFDNVSMDVMFGLPYQFVSSWEHTLGDVIELASEHVSVYALTLEPGTPMEADVRLGKLPEPDSDLAAEMYRLAQRELARAGLRQYEISNWSVPGRASVHNLAYWLSEPYLGVGPGAHSYLFATGAPSLQELGAHGVRFANAKAPRAYIQRVAAWVATGPVTPDGLRTAAAVDTAEELSGATAMGDAMMMGLRLNDGVSDADFSSRFGAGIADRFPDVVAECVELGLLEWAGDRLRLTEDGRPLGNEAFQRFVAAARV